jgi:dynein heavy chain
MQANTWIKSMEREIDKTKVVILDPGSDKIMTTIEYAISRGNVVILENLDEDIDPSFEPILNKSLKTVAGK